MGGDEEYEPRSQDDNIPVPRPVEIKVCGVQSLAEKNRQHSDCHHHQCANPRLVSQWSGKRVGIHGRLLGVVQQPHPEGKEHGGKVHPGVPVDRHDPVGDAHVVAAVDDVAEHALKRGVGVLPTA